jgi:hypothetical protein
MFPRKMGGGAAGNPRSLFFLLLAVALADCSSSGGSPTDGGNNNSGTPASVSVSVSSQPQEVQIPASSGPVTGSITLPPISVPSTASGQLTLEVESGSNVAFLRVGPAQQPQSLVKVRDSDTTLPGGPYIFEMTLTAPFPVSLASVPAFTLNLGALGAALPNGAYTLVVVIGSGAPFQFPVTAQNDSIDFPGAPGPFVVAAGTAITFGLTLASNAPQPSAGPAAVFVVDSTATLFALDANGNVRQKVSLPGTVGDENGGEIALANGNVYVTLGNTTNKVVAYTQATLAPVTLVAGAFSGLFVPRGITYDTHNNYFFVGNGGASVNVYDMSGNSVSAPGGFPGNYGPSGVSYDSDDNTIWVANYVGSPGGDFTEGTAQYNEDGSVARTFDLRTQFVSTNPHCEPYSIAYCNNVNCGAFKVDVGFIDDGSGQGTASVGLYTIDGGTLSSLTTTGPDGNSTYSVTKPYQLAFDSQANLWIADKSGLIWFLPFVGNGLPPGFSGALKPPIYGVGPL